MQIPEFCRRLGCPKPDLRVVHSAEDHFTFECMTCHNVQVVSTDKIKEEAAWKRTVGKHQPEHSWNKPKLTFDFGRTKR